MITSSITAGTLDEAEQDLFEIIYQQRSAFAARWRSGSLYRRGLPFLRVLGVFLSLFGIALAIYGLLKTPPWCPARGYAAGLVLLFLGFFAFFYFLPRLQTRLQDFLDVFIVRSCKKQTARCVANARQQAPFTAEYLLENGQITYSRIQNGKRNVVWTRKLSGVAFQRPCATLIYKKSTSFVPRITILHTDAAVMALALKEQSVEIMDYRT